MVENCTEEQYSDTWLVEGEVDQLVVADIVVVVAGKDYRNTFVVVEVVGPELQPEVAVQHYSRKFVEEEVEAHNRVD